MRRPSICQSTPAFFGLTPEHRPLVHEEVFMLCYYGKGGFTHDEVYNMPRYLRAFYLKQVEKAVKDHNDQQEKSRKKSEGKSEVFSPPIMPKQ